MKLYDAYFRIKHPACFVVEADNAKDAMRVAEEELTRMSKEEIVRRLVDALDFDFVAVECVNEI